MRVRQRQKQRLVDAHSLVGLHGRTVGVTGDGAEVGELVGGGSLDRRTTLRPVGGADLAVLVLPTRNRGRFRESVINGMNANWMHVR